MKKKSILVMAAVAVGFAMSAADLTVVSTEKLNVEGYYPTLSPDGTVMLFTNEDHDGLKAIDLTTKAVEIIDENPGAGFNPTFTADGLGIVYRSVVKQDGLMRRDVKRYDLSTGKTVQLLKPSKGAVNTLAYAGNTFAHGVADKQAIQVSINGDVKEINPIQAGYRYLWTSISPSNKKLLFNEVYSGVYVSELDGTKARHLASRAEFPCWAGDNFVVALYTEDDGYVVTKAKVIAIDVETGKTIDLTGDNIIVNGVSATNDKVVYTTEKGEMFVMNIKITE